MPPASDRIRLHLFATSLAFALGLALVARPAAASVGPDPLGPAERMAVAVVATYLDGGVDAVWPLVASDSEPARLGRSELALRLGPRSGAEWKLARLAPVHGPRHVAFHVVAPSGIEDLLVLEIDPSHRRLVAVRSLADPVQGPVGSMAPLAELRKALLADPGERTPGDATKLGTLLRQPLADPRQDAIRRLWLAQHRLLRLDAPGALHALTRLPPGSPPLQHLLRARAASREGDPVTARRHYAHFIDHGWDVDLVRLEMTRAARNGDDVVAALVDLETIEDLRSRDAEVYYELSRLYLFRDLDASESSFRRAWALRPMERGEILEDPFLAFLLGRRDLFDLLQLDRPDEPRIGPGAGQRKPLRWPAGTSHQVLGQLLVAEVGGSRLVVPGGSPLAPPAVRPRTAQEMRRDEDRRVVAELPQTIRRASLPRALETPRVVRQMERTASALADGGRWNDLLRLTAGLRAATRPPAELARLRADALEELGRTQQALDLLVRLATDAASAREHPRAHFQLARLCAENNRPDLAVGVLRRLQALHPFPGLEQAVLRYQLDVDLDQDYETYLSTHFELRHDDDIERGQAIMVAGFLEAELQRLQDWIPYDVGQGPVEVHLVPAEDFYRVYGGGVGILGLYDGRIRLPVFEVGKESAVMTEVISHELAHAMIDRHTADRAPRWFHEGLAQLVEPDREARNPYHGDGRVISFPLLEPVLRSFNDSQFVGLAYGEAYWILRYVEESHGKAGIRRLLDAFADRHTSDEALRKAFSQDVRSFDAALQRWARNEAPARSEGRQLDYDDATIERMAENTPGFREEIERQAANAPPKVGLNLEGDTAQEQMETLQRKMEDELVDEIQSWMDNWYEVYRTMADSIRRDLRTVVLAVRGVERPQRRLDQVCRDLFFQITSLSASGLVTIDPDVTRSLKAAYRHLGKLAHGCSSGDWMDEEMEQAERHLGEAAYHLEKYGMKP